MLPLALFAVMLAVGFFNGANDVSKSIATLVGSGVTRLRTAIVWGSLWTFAGAACAALASQGLVAAFSGKGLLAVTPEGPAFILSVALGALAWIGIATTTGLPVSTTHAITGGLIGAGVVAAGFSGIQWSFLLARIAVPLAASPLLSLALVFAVFPIVRAGLRRWEGYCVCVQQPARACACDGTVAAMTGPGEIMVAEKAACERSPVTVAGVSVVDGLHWLTAGTTAFARGLNDAPKVLGLGVIAGVALDLPLSWSFMLIAVAMTAGSLLRGFKVTETLAQKVTRMEPMEGFSANLVTSLLVIFASRLALPVSTTHVSSAAIVGLGLRRDAGQVQWSTVRDMLLAWVVTLPAAGLVAAIIYYFLHRIS